MLARFCSRSKALEAFSARARLGSKIISCDIARARLGSKIFSLGSLELEKFTLVPNTITQSMNGTPKSNTPRNNTSTFEKLFT